MRCHEREDGVVLDIGWKAVSCGTQHRSSRKLVTNTSQHCLYMVCQTHVQGSETQLKQQPAFSNILTTKIAGRHIMLRIHGYRPKYIILNDAILGCDPSAFTMQPSLMRISTVESKVFPMRICTVAALITVSFC